MKEINETRDAMTISAVMPAYNAEKYIARALDSVLGQSRPADEIIVIDDGSTDGTAEIVKGYGDKIRYLYQDNAGVSAARNKGIQESSCNWISFIDSDDEWLPENIEMLEGVVKRNGNLVWAFGDFLNCNCSGNAREMAHNKDVAKDLLGKNEYFKNYLKCFRSGFSVSMISNIVKKNVFDEVGVFVVGQHRSEDTDLWLRISYEWPEVGYVAEPLAIYHRGIATSNTSSYRDFDIITSMIEKHLKLSAEKGFYDEFLPCGRSMLGNWIRSMLSTGDTDELLDTVERFDELLTWRFKKEMWLRVKYPRVAPIALAMTSTIKKCKRFLIDRFGLGRDNNDL